MRRRNTIYVYIYIYIYVCVCVPAQDRNDVWSKVSNPGLKTKYFNEHMDTDEPFI